VLLTSVLDRRDGDERPSFKRLSAIRAWTDLAELLSRSDITAAMSREQIVQHAHECVRSGEVHGLLHVAFETNIASKLWHALRFVARPVLDCWMLRNIASQHPQFRKLRIFLVPPRSKMAVDVEYQTDITDAWARLNSAPPPAADMKMLAVFGARFKRDCAASYAQHAEIQLFTHYEEHPNLSPTLRYFGCSKKACLLCEGFLAALPSPIDTRGRHGICYPAWGVPSSRSAGAKTALIKLENMLVTRIKTFLGAFGQARKTHFAPPTGQSTIVSSFSGLTVQEFLQRQDMVRSANKTETAMREKRLIR